MDFGDEKHLPLEAFYNQNIKQFSPDSYFI